jgi:hypothetical protein
MCHIVYLCVCLTQSCVGLLSEPKTLRLVMVVQYLDNLRATPCTGTRIIIYLFTYFALVSNARCSYYCPLGAQEMLFSARVTSRVS